MVCVVTPTYTPDLATIDYHIFCSLQNFLDAEAFNSKEEVSQAVENFFQTKPITSYREGIDKLQGRWEKVVHNSGEYIIKVRNLLMTRPNKSTLLAIFESVDILLSK